MKKNILLLIICYFSVTSLHADNVTSIQLGDVVKRVSQSNYNVYENALKVYQAKANIEKARADLLPKLSIWTVAGAILDPISLFGNATDVAPFLVPANWFRVQEIKLLYLAEKEGYRALWGNEIHSAKTLYNHILFDQQLFVHIQSSITELEKIYRIVKTRETFGGVEPGTARDIEIRILGLKDDQENLRILLSLEHDELSYALGYPSSTTLDLSAIDLPDVAQLKPLDTNGFEFRMLSVAPERRQFEHFSSVLDQIKKEIDYSVLGVSQVSRGVAGGVFDSIPISNGLGFGREASTKILNAQREIFKTQKTGVEETLKRQLKSVGVQFNSDINNYQNFVRRAELAKSSKESILRRLQLGENIDIVALSESSRNEILARTALFTVQYRVLNTQDRLQRLLFEGDYNMNPPLIDSLKGK